MLVKFVWRYLFWWVHNLDVAIFFYFIFLCVCFLKCWLKSVNWPICDNLPNRTETDYHQILDLPNRIEVKHSFGYYEIVEIPIIHMVPSTSIPQYYLGMPSRCATVCSSPSQLTNTLPALHYEHLSVTVIKTPTLFEINNKVPQVRFSQSRFLLLEHEWIKAGWYFRKLARIFIKFSLRLTHTVRDLHQSLESFKLK